MNRSLRLFALIALLTALMPFAAKAQKPVLTAPVFPTQDDTADPSVAKSHRLIVQLQSPSLAEFAELNNLARRENGLVDTSTADATAYIAQLEAEQSAFVQSLSSVLPASNVASYVNEFGQAITADYQITFNGLTIEPGTADLEKARELLLGMPGVKAVYYDYANETDMYASLPIINVEAAWNNADIGGGENAGQGIKVASMDGGVHKDAPMFSGEGYEYPAGFPENGLGLTANNNGKIIASRAYFRNWDPPAEGEDNPWPGMTGTSHGVHTAGTAVGEFVDANYLGFETEMSGVAPKAWVMSYRVFYNSANGIGSFYNAEGIAALEDIVRDGADVVNNSWGGGPSSAGGEADALDLALINASRAGVFVSMSAGNAGHGKGTTDHPSSEYISVAATTTDGTLANGRLNVTAPEPVPPALQGITYSGASFGATIPTGQTIPFDFITALSVNPSNVTGCTAWAPNVFDGKAALISRGGCEFGVKVVNAEQAGAEFVIVYNNVDDGLINMGPGAVGDQATIASIFIGKTAGDAMVAWYTTNGAASALELNTEAFQAGNTPDIVANFSSRGPGVGNVLKPDIAAPGVNILSQGYTPNTTGEARHLGYGQVSGTSMASPHVAGAAALLRQIHPTWTNDQIKSALMSTAQYMDIFTHLGGPAQPLDMGAGRLDLTNAADPGVFLSPPSLSFGAVAEDAVSSIELTITSAATTTETYSITTLFTGAGFEPEDLTALPGFTVTPDEITLAPGESATVTVTFDAMTSAGIGDNQGYVVLTSANYEAHLPAWARVQQSGTDKVLVIDNDFSVERGLRDYRPYYVETLTNMGIDFDVIDTSTNIGQPTFIPEAAVLAQYDAIIYFTGDNFYPNGTFTVSTGLTILDQNRLTEYANDGGVIFAMGQDLAAVLRAATPSGGEFFHSFVLGAQWLQNSLTDSSLPTNDVMPTEDAPAAFQNVTLDLSPNESVTVGLYGANEVPPVATANSGSATLTYDDMSNELFYDITINATEEMTVTMAHFHEGMFGQNGPVVQTIAFSSPLVITDTATITGAVTLSMSDEVSLFNEMLYINIHTEENPSGELRGQVMMDVVSDAAGNQVFIDEIESSDSTNTNIVPIFKLNTPHVINEGVVGIGHRAQPTLENPVVTYYGRTIYTTFGLEGVNNNAGTTTREELMAAMFAWADEEPTITISNTTDTTNSSNFTRFEAVADGHEFVSYRWDFGDGSEYTDTTDSIYAGHTYETCGTYTVRLEATTDLGNKVVVEQEVEVVNCVSSQYTIMLPIIVR